MMKLSIIMFTSFQLLLCIAVGTCSMVNPNAAPHRTYWLKKNLLAARSAVDVPFIAPKIYLMYLVNIIRFA